MQSFPSVTGIDEYLTIKTGKCPHRRIIPELVDLVRSGRVDPFQVLALREPLTPDIDAYKAFETRQPGWIKVEPKPSA